MSKNFGTRKIVTMLIIGAILLVILFSTVGTIHPGHVGILMNFGVVSNEIKKEGIYIIFPFVQTIKQIDARTQKLEWVDTESAIIAMSKDLLDIYIQATVTYHPIAERCGEIYKNMGPDYAYTIISPLTMDVLKTHIGKHTVTELVSNKQQITSEISNDISQKLQPYNIILEFISLSNIDFRPSVKAAIEQRVIAEKQVETQKFTLEKQALEAQQQVKKAEADKNAKILQAEAEEIFNKKIAGSITEMLLKYKALQTEEKVIEKWNGIYPNVVAGGESLPIIQLPLNTNE